MARISRSRDTAGHAAVFRTSGRVLISPAACCIEARRGRRSGERILRVSTGAASEMLCSAVCCSETALYKLTYKSCVVTGGKM